ncbi:MAG: helix-turn-helix domain-containing protein [Candidatus Woesearchaeota archaeon]
MYEELLREVGLSPNEARVYEALLQLGETSVQKISLKSKVHRRNVYDSLAKLMEKGLASEVFIKGEKHFKAQNPNRLLSLLKEKEEIINKELPEMQAKYEALEEKEEAHLYRGIEGVKNYLQDILKTKETVYFIGAKGMWLDPRLKHFLPHFERERKQLGIKFKHIFDYEVREKLPEIIKLVGKPYKFLPKEYSSPTMVDIFGDYVTTFISSGEPGILPEEPIQFVMKSRKLADGYRKFWQFMWDNIAED